MRARLICSIVVVLLTASSPDAGAQGASPIRLRARTFTPAANVGPAKARTASVRLAGHFLVQFAGDISQRDLKELRDRGVTPLRYVPDHALAIAAPHGFDPASVPNVRWVGTLLPSDKVSDDTLADLARPRLRFQRTVVEFHSDVPPAVADALLAQAGGNRLSTPHLPAWLAVMTTDGGAIQRLAAEDAVAWIYPAAPELLAPGAIACEGVVAGQGVVASYATVGDGWDGPGQGTTALSYSLRASSSDWAPAEQAMELRRALDEWSRHIDVRWTEAPHGSLPRSVTVSWGATDHGDGFPFAPEVLAHAFYPSPMAAEYLAGDIHFNDGFEWGVSDPYRYDIYSVALHEIGHSLGLTHSSNPDAVMYAMYRGILGGLSEHDVRIARSLYAKAPGIESSGWTTVAVGSGIQGSITRADDRFVIEASGADIWGTADQMQFAWRTLEGDGDIVARVDSLLAVHRWSKAGVMLRAHEGASSPHAFMLVSGAKGLAFQRRSAEGAESVHTDGGPGAAPVWLWLSRRGDRFAAYAAADGGTWRLVGSDTIVMGRRILAGPAVTSHDPAAVASATFSSVSVMRAQWTGTDVGPVKSAGSWQSLGQQLRVTASGVDVWGQADEFHYVWQRLSGDGEIVARVASLQYAHAWSKAGVMIRSSLDPASPHAFMLVSAGKGYAFQRRLQPGGLSDHTTGGAGSAPQWVRLARKGHVLTAYRSDDGANWVVVGSDVIPMGGTVLAGVAVTSHNATVTCDAVFDAVSITDSRPTSSPPG